MISRTIVVQRDPDGLSPLAQGRVVLRAVNLTRGLYPGLERIAGALPLTNTLGLVGPDRSGGDTALTLLFFRPDVGVAARERIALRFVDEHLDPELDAPVGITGAVPGRLQQARLVKEHLPLVELLTVLLIVTIVGIHFRSIGASLLVLLAAGVAYAISVRLIAWVLGVAGLGLPEELEPLVVVLLLGIVTDYSIFFLDHARGGLRAGRPPLVAATAAVRETAPIVGTAGIAVALGTAALVVARLDTFRALGPGMALTVLVGLAVSVTFVPAVIALGGRWLFWPSVGPAVGRSEPAPKDRASQRMRWLTHRPRAIWISSLGVLVLIALSFGTASIRLGFSIVGALPPDSPPRVAAAAATEGFGGGVISPTILLLGSRDDRILPIDDVLAVQRALEQRPTIEGVIGPADVSALARLAARVPTAVEEELPASPERLILGGFVTPDRTSARMMIILDGPPLAGPAIRAFRELRADLPRVLLDAGLDPRRVRVGLAGDTALAAETIDQTVDDLVRIVAAVGLLMVALLAVFLRALVGAVLLVIVSLLGFVAALGLTAVASRAFGVASMSFFVPFASAVLLVSLGSDYNIFLVGRVWRSARGVPLREAIVAAAPAASRAIAVAGVTLAGSFAVLATVPLRPLRQFAVAMAGGILLDTFVIRAVIVPVLLAAVGPIAGWPGPVWRRARTLRDGRGTHPV